MKKIENKRIIKWTILSVFLIILATIIVGYKKIPLNISKSENNKFQIQEEKFEYEVYDKTSSPIKALVKINGKKEIDKIEYFDGTIMYCNNETNIAKDVELDVGINYEVSIFYKDGEKSTKNIYIEADLYEEFNYTGTEQVFCAQVSGYYKLQAYGASGGTGYGNRNPIGLGGYTEGKVYLEKGQQLYIHVGAQGVGQTLTGSYNGGGSSGGDYDHRGGQGRRSYRF